MLILASEYFRIAEAIIEKDYYVSVVLKTIGEHIPEIIFKGGTSLSKAYKLIDRFSEDIDLSFFQENLSPPSDAQRRTLKRKILTSVEEAGLAIGNLEDVQSRRKFNRYEVNYPNVYTDSHLKNHLLIETYCHFVPYPV
ncbi:nucleotidyl transferase AbiEii/AbiGii toxin family protein [Saccharibacillus sp. CPCC 101409]|uniref:nucleotidyl transferase AbiEii/AbiGii toxin family protein n=1 Tax=Saccharibacillus sp. CPCC 101409 TaxID=3058041 RepID=UPI002671BF1F|nr:nucleotidyl transferase AbiEii/AbiGii toxin family protein [Saccharibacillus sp. CPCC 101409]MDO3408232.1 nucleotidyl transferase AbiEii/AbiGii toxin family protein [Saccharibacillus sp. CPCC 101409]